MLDADAADAVNAGSGTMPSVSGGRVAAAGTAAATHYHNDTYLGARRAISCRAMVRGMCSCMLAQGRPGTGISDQSRQQFGLVTSSLTE